MTNLQEAIEEAARSHADIFYPEDIELLKKNPNIAKLPDKVIQILWEMYSDSLYASWRLVLPGDWDMLWEFANQE